MDGAHCNYMLNTKPPEDYNKMDWDAIRFGQACTEVQSISDLIGVVEKLCFDTGRCTYDQKKLVHDIRLQFDKFVYDVWYPH